MLSKATNARIRGMTLVETMVTLVVATIGGLALLTLTTNMQKSANTTKRQLDAVDLRNGLNGLIASNLCQSAVSGQFNPSAAASNRNVSNTYYGTDGNYPIADGSWPVSFSVGSGTSQVTYSEGTVIGGNLQILELGLLSNSSTNCLPNGGNRVCTNVQMKMILSLEPTTPPGGVRSSVGTWALPPSLTPITLTISGSSGAGAIRNCQASGLDPNQVCTALGGTPNQANNPSAPCIFTSLVTSPRPTNNVAALASPYTTRIDGTLSAENLEVAGTGAAAQAGSNPQNGATLTVGKSTILPAGAPNNPAPTSLILKNPRDSEASPGTGTSGPSGFLTYWGNQFLTLGTTGPGGGTATAYVQFGLNQTVGVYPSLTVSNSGSSSFKTILGNGNLSITTGSQLLANNAPGIYFSIPNGSTPLTGSLARTPAQNGFPAGLSLTGSYFMGGTQYVPQVLLGDDGSLALTTRGPSMGVITNGYLQASQYRYTGTNIGTSQRPFMVGPRTSMAISHLEFQPGDYTSIDGDQKNAQGNPYNYTPSRCLAPGNSNDPCSGAPENTHFVHSWGPANEIRFGAPIRLPAGSVIDSVQCVINKRAGNPTTMEISDTDLLGAGNESYTCTDISQISSKATATLDGGNTSGPCWRGQNGNGAATGQPLGITIQSGHVYGLVFYHTAGGIPPWFNIWGCIISYYKPQVF